MVFHKRISILFTSLLLMFGCFMYAGNTATCEAAASPYKNIVTPNTTSYIYIRKTYNMNSAKIGKFSKGDGATILKKGTTWYKIQSGDIVGYVKKKYLLSGTKLEAFAEKNNFAKKIKINVRSLIVREKASKSSDIVTGVNKDEVYPVIRETKKWAKIEAEGGTGYVLKQYTTWSYDLGTAEKCNITSTSTSSTTSEYSDVAVCCVDADKRLNIRKEASTSSAVVGYMTPGSSAKIITKGTEWTKIQYGSYFGYINNEFYFSGSQVDAYAKKIGLGKTATLNANMNVRKKASVSSKRLGGAIKGTTYTVKKETANWVAISFKGTTGYLKKSYLTLKYSFKDPVFYTSNTSDSSTDSDNTSSGTTTDNTSGSGSTNVSGSEIVSYALKFLGNPYVYGGTSLTEGCDCSGFTQSVFKHFGISIPRVSRDQANSGTAVALSDIQAGDLIFYANSSGTINHVGIYMGNGRIVNASNAKVGIITYTYTYRTPVKAVRYY